MNKQKLHLVWWLCMLPWLAATAVLSFQYYKNPNETSLLGYVIGCLFVGLIFAILIVRASGADELRITEEPDMVEASLDSDEELEDASSMPEPAELPEPVRSEALPQFGTHSQLVIALGPGKVDTNEVPPEAHHPTLDFKPDTRTWIFNSPPESAHPDLSVESVQQLVARLENDVAKAETVAAQLKKGLNQNIAAESRESRTNQNIAAESREPRSNQNIAAESREPRSNQNITAESREPRTNQNITAERRESSKPEAKTLLSERKMTECSSIEEWLAKADELMAANDFDSAIKCFDNVTKLDVKNFEAWFLKSVALKRKHQFEDALYCANYALGLKNQSPDALSLKGECLLELGKTDQAIVWFDKSLSLDKVALKPWLGKGMCLAAMSRHRDAMACFDKVLIIQPDNQAAQEAKRACQAKMGVTTG